MADIMNVPIFPPDQWEGIWRNKMRNMETEGTMKYVCTGPQLQIDEREPDTRLSSIAPPYPPYPPPFFSMSGDLSPADCQSFG